MDTSDELVGAADIAPSQTLYINNLNEKIKKGALKKALYSAFSQFGRMVDIVALKTEKLRGQAWIVFADVPSAGNAMKAMQGFALYEKPLKIQYAKTKSHSVEKLEGTYRPRAKRQRDEAPESKQPVKRARAGDAAPAPVATAPSNKLLVQNLPALPAEMLSAFLRELFGRFPGMQEVRPVEARRLAFVEYESEAAAAPALQALHNYAYEGANALSVSFAR